MKQVNVHTWQPDGHRDPDRTPDTYGGPTGDRSRHDQLRASSEPVADKGRRLEPRSRTSFSGKPHLGGTDATVDLILLHGVVHIRLETSTFQRLHHVGGGILVMLLLRDGHCLLGDSVVDFDVLGSQSNLRGNV